MSEPPAVVPGAFDLVWIEGSDAVAFADGQLSQDVAGMTPGEVRRSLLLEPRGKLRGILWAVRLDDAVGLATWAGTGAGVVEDLDRFLFRVDASLSVHAGTGAAVLEPDGGPAGRWEGSREALVIRPPAGSWPAAIVTGEAHPGRTVTAAEALLARVRGGEPVFGLDVDEGTIPQETGLVPEAVSFTKGCYLGQELVARIDSRGHVNRMLRRVEIAGSPPSGASVEWGDDGVGSLGTVASTGDGAEALGVLRREVEPGASVTITWPGGRAPGRVAEIPRAHTLRTGDADDAGAMKAEP
jgi:folate-binding protein YgfZ